jgi:hypothetical protein
MASRRTLLEQAIVAALGPLAKMHGGRVAPYNGEIAKALQSEEDLRVAFGGSFPSILVATGQGRFTDFNLQRKRATLNAEIEIVIASGDLRTRVARTQGTEESGGKPGIYDVLEMIQNVLLGSDLGLAGCGPLQPLTEEALINAPDLCVWIATYQAQMDVVRPKAIEVLLTDLRGNANLPEDEETRDDPTPLVSFDEEVPT